METVGTVKPVETVETRPCGRCKRELPFSKFGNYSGLPDGKAKNCRDCRKEIVKSSMDRIKKRKLEQMEAVDMPVPTTKRCSGCKETKELSNFSKDNSRLDGLRWYCKQCDQGFKKIKMERNRSHIRKKRQEMGPCVDCGESNPNLLQFDHVKGEKLDVVTALWSKQRIDEEITKTVMRCIMCHRYKSAKEQSMRIVPNIETVDGLTRKRNRDFVREQKAKIGGCEICKLKIRTDDIFHFACFDFDHLNPSEKVAGISVLASHHYTLEKIQQEIAKCRLLCAACHWLHTREQFSYK